MNTFHVNQRQISVLYVKRKIYVNKFNFSLLLNSFIHFHPLYCFDFHHTTLTHCLRLNWVLY